MHGSSKTILMCSCEDTMRLDTAAVKRGCRNSEIATFRQLCRAELDQFRNAAKAEGSLIVGCTQEAPLFADEAGERAERNRFRQPARDGRLVRGGGPGGTENGGPARRRFRAGA